MYVAFTAAHWPMHAKENDLAKDAAMTVVIEMYCIYRESMLSDEELTIIGIEHAKEQKRRAEIKSKRLMKKRTAAGELISPQQTMS